MSAGCGGRLGEEGLAENSDRVVTREPGEVRLEDRLQKPRGTR